jgi:aminomethyltransferase
MNLLTPRDISKVKVGQCRYVFLSNQDGAAGPTRMMKGAFIDGEAFHKNNEHRWRVFDGEQLAGEVISAVYSPRLERNIGFMLADIAYAENGTRLEVDPPEGRRELEVTDLPFLDKDKTIPRRSLRS